MTQLLEVGPLRVAYTQMGAGPALLLLHGGEGSHHMFDAVMPLLAKNFNVFAYDQRDCGETQGPAAVSSLRELAGDAADFLRAVGVDRAHVYGSSFGGRIAQTLAIEHPDVVDRLVLGATWPLSFALADLSPNITDILRLRAGLPETSSELAEYFLPVSFLETRPELRNLFSAATPTTARAQRRGQAIDDNPPLDISRIRAPTLVLIGEVDRVVPPSVTLGLAERLPRAQVASMAGVGHAAVLQAPDVVSRQVTEFCLDPRPTFKGRP